MNGGKVEIHRFEVRVGGNNVKDPIQGQVGGGEGTEGKRVEVRLEQWRGPFKRHVLESESVQVWKNHCRGRFCTRQPGPLRVKCRFCTGYLKFFEVGSVTWRNDEQSPSNHAKIAQWEAYLLRT